MKSIIKAVLTACALGATIYNIVLRGTTIIFVFSLLLCSSALACRPLTVDDCPPTERGKVGLESGLTSTRSTGTDYLSGITTVKYGLLDNLDIGVDLPYLRYIPAGGTAVSGPGDASVKAKIAVIPSTDHFAGLSFTAGAKLNTGDTAQGLGSGATDYSFNSILTKEWTRFALHLNLGYTLTGQTAGQNLRNVVNYGCAFETALAAGTKLLGEVYGATNSDPASAVNPLAATLGANKEVLPGLTADVGWSVGLNDAAPNRILTVGLTGTI